MLEGKRIQTPSPSVVPKKHNPYPHKLIVSNYFCPVAKYGLRLALLYHNYRQIMNIALAKIVSCLDLLAVLLRKLYVIDCREFTLSSRQQSFSKVYFIAKQSICQALCQKD
jgi:hypothetical protein